MGVSKEFAGFWMGICKREINERVAIRIIEDTGFNELPCVILSVCLQSPRCSEISVEKIQAKESVAMRIKIGNKMSI